MTDSLSNTSQNTNDRTTEEHGSDTCAPVSQFEQWHARNEAHLRAIVDWSRQVLAGFESDAADSRAQEPAHVLHARYRCPAVKQPSIDESLIDESPEDSADSAVNVLIDQFGLNESDQAVLALVTAAALDSDISRCIAVSQMGRERPTAGFCIATIPECDWSSFSPHSPLRYWLLIDWQPLGSGNGELNADERIVNFIRGLNYIDERLLILLEPLSTNSSFRLMPSQQQQVDVALSFLSQQHVVASQQQSPAVIELYGDDLSVRVSVAQAIAAMMEKELLRLNGASLPTSAIDLDALSRLWLREARLYPMLLMVDITDTSTRQLTQFIGRLSGLVLLNTGRTPANTVEHAFPLKVVRPTAGERELLWQQYLGDQIDSQLCSRLAEQFYLGESEIRRLASVAMAECGSIAATNDEMAEASSRHSKKLETRVWQICQQSASTDLAKLATKIDGKACWDNLVLPEPQTRLLSQLVSQVAMRGRVYQQWGFRDRMSRGMGISVMFSGESGTGKTMAAEVIANALNLELYRIDLASVISKYIGETEKQMRALFEAAEQSGAILFFDEADALFGKRGEVKNSNDRFANIGIDDLLQRIESYSGLAILATNLKSAVDKAFLRRLRFVIDFPFPGPVERERIWQSVFPPHTPLAADFNPAHLAKLNLTGGNIQNVALNGAFLAAQHDQPVSMRWLMDAAAAELQKLERPVKAGDLDYG
ncbi:ATP-binding protein [Veronia pacifica]|uniref:AAA family ATPase n=1 Tax=Veronia pacifica TaxID=1080227 RepID=A0A1C3EEE6_9GAMM|nr:ATP-binding protein [Veronia pacifica]ODA31590.1 AAA family ATPase [Veronia pacifica]